MQETPAQAYGRALVVWGQWLRQWRLTRSPRALLTALICEQIAAEKLADWHGDLKLNRSAIRAARAERAAREELCLHKIMRQIRRDERELRATQMAAPEDMARWARDLADELPRHSTPRDDAIMAHYAKGSKVIRRSLASR
jgi:hypothetical protein